MNEVEKMYRNVLGYVCNMPDVDCFHECEKCDSYITFTAEKQIAIIQLLTQQCDLTISHFTEWEFIHFDGQEPIQVTGKDFTETFAKLINEYWQSLTEEEKEAVRGILRT